MFDGLLIIITFLLCVCFLERTNEKQKKWIWDKILTERRQENGRMRMPCRPQPEVLTFQFDSINKIWDRFISNCLSDRGPERTASPRYSGIGAKLKWIACLFIFIWNIFMNYIYMDWQSPSIRIINGNMVGWWLAWWMVLLMLTHVRSRTPFSFSKRPLTSIIISYWIETVDILWCEHIDAC